MSITILPIEILELEEDSYHLFIKAEFQNKTGELVIDTGASKTVFDRNFIIDDILEFQTRENEITSSGINNEIEDIEFVTINQIKLNDFVIKNFKTAIMDLSHINSIYKKFGNKFIAGLIGSDFLFKYNALISYKDSQLILEY